MTGGLVTTPAVVPVAFMQTGPYSGVVWFLDAPAASDPERPVSFALWADRWGGGRYGVWSANETRADQSARKWSRLYSAVVDEFGEMVEVDECPVL